MCVGRYVTCFMKFNDQTFTDVARGAGASTGRKLKFWGANLGG